jgi:hypothetical protein
MNPIKVNYRIACVTGLIIGVILLAIAIVKMLSEHRGHAGLIAWGVWFIASMIFVWVMGARAETAASDAENGQTFGFLLSYIGAGNIIIIVAAAIPILLTLFVGI